MYHDNEDDTAAPKKTNPRRNSLFDALLLIRRIKILLEYQDCRYTVVTSVVADPFGMDGGEGSPLLSFLLALKPPSILQSCVASECRGGGRDLYVRPSLYGRLATFLKPGSPSPGSCSRCLDPEWNFLASSVFCD